MQTAPISLIQVKKSIAIALALTAAAFLLPKSIKAAAGAPQACDPSSTCVVGEFLYDDTYTPITTADICSLNARYPNGDAYITDQNMAPSANSDGWYSYSFTAPATTGFYRAQVCCEVDGEDMCLDKSFEVKSTSGGASTGDIATAVWGYSSRTLSSFGSLASDVWNYTTRSLSSFGNLVSDIWGNSSRTITGTSGTDLSNLATKADVAENKKLLEQLVNKPIIENFIEEVPDLSTKINETKATASQLFINTEYLISKSALLSAKWNSLTSGEISDTVDELGVLVGDESNGLSDNSIYGKTNWMKEAWSFDIVDSMLIKIKSVKASLAGIQKSIDSHAQPARDLKSLVDNAKGLEKLIGDISNTNSQPTLFGKVKETTELASLLEQRSADADKILASWNFLTTKEKQIKIIELRRSVAAVNLLPKVGSVLSAQTQANATDKDLKNKILSYKGIVSSNQILLAKSAGKPLTNTWLEEGSMVFKSLITNPSRIVSQKVPLKYYLPPEVKEENIIEVDSGLKVAYDTEKNQYYVEGEFTLVPGETRTLSVKVTDIWVVSDADVESMRKQAEDLAKPLERTSYFAQGVTLKSDINVSLDKVLSLEQSATTPEEKIRAFREAQIELAAAKEKMDSLKNLATQAGSAGSLFGFVGGAQTLAVWGLIVIIVGGFIWLAVSMRAIRKSEAIEVVPVKGATKKEKIVQVTPAKKGNKIITIAIPFLAILIAVGVTSSIITKKAVEKSKAVLGQETQVQEPISPACTTQNPIENSDEATGGEETVRINVVKNTAVVVRESPDATSKVIARFGTTRDVTKIGESGEWTNIVFDNDTSLNSLSEGWVETKYVISKDAVTETSTDSTSDKIVTIKDTSTGWLRVRTSPNGEEITKVNPGDKFNFIDQKSGWIQIELPNTQTGWISGQYATIN